ncbi:MAG TPA: hypothetical protein VFV11_06475 [Solimonas sp.]|nr:hypothetical protein [Solimonas sp.]
MHLALLLLTLAALLSGPAIYALARARPRLLRVLDPLVVVSVAGLVLIEVLPEIFRAGGLWSAAFLLVGLLGPTLFEHLMTRARREAHIAALAVAILGLLLHSLGDGIALSPAGGSHHEALGLAVAIHSIPVGLLVWWLMFPVFGAGPPAAVLAAMCTVTTIGYHYGLPLNAALGAQGWEWLQALVAGSILHVVFGRPHLQNGHHDHGH